MSLFINLINFPAFSVKLIFLSLLENKSFFPSQIFPVLYVTTVYVWLDLFKDFLVMAFMPAVSRILTK